MCGRIARDRTSIQASGVGDPAYAAACDSSHAKKDPVAVLQLLFAVFEELDQGAVDVAVAQEAEVVVLNSDFLARD